MSNCKEGDLAIIYRSVPGKEHNLGKIVRIVRPSKKGEIFVSTCGYMVQAVGCIEPAWVIEGVNLKWVIENGVYNFNERALKDEFLKPIKPLDDLEGEDEMIKIIKPKKVKHEQAL